MRIDPPAFPLTAAAFTAALQAGHGRAMQQVERHGTRGLEDALTQACASCLVHDPQSEAERAPWLFSLVNRARLASTVIEAIGAGLREPSDDHWSLEQRCALLKEFAAAGSIDARRLLYASLARLPHRADVVGAEQIVALDGVDGLIHVARQLGRWLKADPHFWDRGSFCDDGSTGVDGGLAALERAAMTDPDIARYLATVRKRRDALDTLPHPVDRNAFTGDEIVAQVRANPRDACHWLGRWGSQTTGDHRETVFTALLAAENPEHVKRLCRCFSKTGVPRFDGRLLRWIADPDDELRWAAVQAVSPLKHETLRQAAWRWIAAGRVTDGIRLLVTNFEAGDFTSCEAHLKRLDDADDAHHLVIELLALCEAHPGPDALACLLYAYEMSPCSSCRERAAKALIGSNTAPAWVRSEIAFDANPDTRALATRSGPA